MTDAHVITRASLQDDTFSRMMAASAPGLRLLTDEERAASLAATLAGRPETGCGVWLFAYGSLIWNPALHFDMRRLARVHGWHRALKMWSRVNRGTPQNPGLVFGLLSGGSCRGMVFRIPKADALETLGRLWLREMPTGVYDPRWLDCVTPGGTVRALAFTLSRRSPNFTGELSDARYREIFSSAVGRYGSSLDYAQQTLQELRRHAIHDAALARLVRLAADELAAGADGGTAAMRLYNRASSNSDQDLS